MKKQLITFVFALLPLVAMAAGGSGWQLDKVNIDPSDKASLQSGAKLYMNYCMSCHSLGRARYERTADDLGIPHDLFLNNLVFDGGAKIGSLMENAMRVEDAKKWFGAPPPDLTLVTRARGNDWVYTYLRTFYQDPARPYGVNNKVFPDVGMPHVLMELQGLQACAPGIKHGPHGGIERDDQRNPILDEHAPCGSLKVAQAGTLSPEQYDAAVRDLVNFLAYVAEPMVEDRQRIGKWTLLFLALLFVFAYLLNREYWKDVH